MVTRSPGALCMGDDFAEFVTACPSIATISSPGCSPVARRRPSGITEPSNAARASELTSESAEPSRRFCEAPALLGTGHAQLPLAQLAAAARTPQAASPRELMASSSRTHVALTLTALPLTARISSPLSGSAAGQSPRSRPTMGRTLVTPSPTPSPQYTSTANRFEGGACSSTTMRWPAERRVN